MTKKKVQSHPKVSVLLFTYNQERYIGQAIESALAQETNFRYEVLIGDDCSTDSTRRIVRAYARRNPDKIRLFLQPHNLNLKHFPTLLAKCRGEYVALLEGDDYWTSTCKLQLQADYLDANPGCSLCFHSVAVRCEEGAECLLPDVFPAENFPSQSSTEDLLERNFIHTASAVFRRRLMSRRPAWINALPLGDWPTWTLLSLRGYIGYLPGVMAVYRVHPGGTWSSQREKALRGTVEMFEAFEKHLPKDHLAAIRRSLHGLRGDLVAYLQNRKVERAATDSGPGKASGRLQVFTAREGSYHENYSSKGEFDLDIWQRVQVDLPRGLGDGTAPLRFDPGDKVGVVEVAGVTLRSGVTGEILWRLNTREELGTLTVGGTAVTLPHERLLRLFSYAADPQIFLPPLQGPQFEGPLALEAWIRLDSSPRFIVDSLQELQLLRLSVADLRGTLVAHEQHRAELQVQVERLRRDLRSSQDELAARESDTRRLHEEFTANERERSRLLEELGVRDQERSHLLEELAAREKERGQLLRRKGEEEGRRFVLQQALANSESETAELHEVLQGRETERLQLREHIEELTGELESSRRTLREIRARRADATARLNKREELLHDIQNSLMWKIVKPIWKMHESRVRAKRSVKSRATVAFSIDLPETWVTHSESLFIKGWCFDPSGGQIVGVRAKIGRKSYLGEYGLERTDVMNTIGHGTTALLSGFTIECSVPVGVSNVTLEAIIQGDDWRLFFAHEILREAPQALATAHGGQVSASFVRNQQASRSRSRMEEELDLLRSGFQRHAVTAENTSPRFSVITPTFNSQIGWLGDAARSLLSQTVPNWEWCIVDDGSSSSETKTFLEGLAILSPRVRVRFAKSAGISSATNEALALASGKYVCFMDHDDFLEPSALKTVSSKMEEGFDVVYSDEDKYDDESRQFLEPFFKPDWSPEYFRGVMYVGHLLTVRRILAQKIGFDKTFDGVQDFDFMLRVSEATSRIGHIPKILYHWRKVIGSVADRGDAKPGLDLLQKQAVDAHLERLALPAVTTIQGGHRLRITPLRRSDPPNISILVPTKDAPLLIGRCLESIYQKTAYPNFRVILVDNGTTDTSALNIMRSYPVQRVEFPGRFNFSRANNVGSEVASDGFLVFLNNDTEVLTPDWLDHLLYYAEQPDVGAVGPMLLYGDRTVQHAGVALGMRGTADHLMRGFPPDVDGYAGSLTCAREVSAVTAACLMMSKSMFDMIGGFNEYFATAYQDVDLCLRLRQRGMRVIYTPQAVLIHHESASRQDYYDMVDRMFLLDRWETLIERGDPYYNPNFDLERGDYSLGAA